MNRTYAEFQATDANIDKIVFDDVLGDADSLYISPVDNLTFVKWEGDTPGFLSGITHTIYTHAEFKVRLREAGSPWVHSTGIDDPRFLRLPTTDITDAILGATIHESVGSVISGEGDNSDESIIVFTGDKVQPLHGLTEITANQTTALIEAGEFSLPSSLTASEAECLTDGALRYLGYSQLDIDLIRFK